MPDFDDSTTTKAAPVEVWKVLYDPLRFPDWWSGYAAVTPGDANGGPGDVTVWPEGYPDFPLPQMVETRSQDHRVVVSCTVSDLVFDWRLEPLDPGTRISVHVEIPEQEAARLATQRAVIASSLRRLAELAEIRAARPARD
jgi:Polyketide cyclase / dehydrase and lipid transport